MLQRLNRKQTGERRQAWNISMEERRHIHVYVADTNRRNNIHLSEFAVKTWLRNCFLCRFTGAANFPHRDWLLILLRLRGFGYFQSHKVRPSKWQFFCAFFWPLWTLNPRVRVETSRGRPRLQFGCHSRPPPAMSPLLWLENHTKMSLLYVIKKTKQNSLTLKVLTAVLASVCNVLSGKNTGNYF